MQYLSDPELLILPKLTHIYFFPLRSLCCHTWFLYSRPFGCHLHSAYYWSMTVWILVPTPLTLGTEKNSSLHSNPGNQTDTPRLPNLILPIPSDHFVSGPFSEDIQTETLQSFKVLYTVVTFVLYYTRTWFSFNCIIPYFLRNSPVPST